MASINRQFKYVYLHAYIDLIIFNMLYRLSFIIVLFYNIIGADIIR